MTSSSSSPCRYPRSRLHADAPVDIVELVPRWFPHLRLRVALTVVAAVGMLVPSLSTRSGFRGLFPVLVRTCAIVVGVLVYVETFWYLVLTVITIIVALGAHENVFGNQFRGYRI